MKCDNCKKEFKDSEITILKDAWHGGKIIGYFCKQCLEKKIKEYNLPPST